MNDAAGTLALFAGFTPAEARAALPYFKVVAVADGQTLFNEGDPGDTLCIVDDGKVRVTKGEREIACMIRGRAFGEMAVLDGRPRSATCRAAGRCSVLTLDDPALRRMMKERPEAAAKVLHALASSLASRLRRADSRLLEVLWSD